MKVLLLNGSPNQHGCTHTALCEVARAIEESGIETEILWIGNQAVRGCIGCGGCARSGKRRCVFGDDLVNTALDKMRSCDGLVVGSPVHYAAAGGSITSFLDRMFYAAAARCAPKSAQPFAARAARARPPRSTSFPSISPSAGHAHCAQPVLADGAWQHAGGCASG